MRFPKARGARVDSHPLSAQSLVMKSLLQEIGQHGVAPAPPAAGAPLLL
jgi:hypothetical protein